MKPILAIITTNKNQYSETFIQSHIAALPFRKIIYANGYLPSEISLDLGKTYTSLSRNKRWWKRHSTEDNLRDSLRQQKVEFVLAEYGTSGVEVLSVCQQLGLPLIVHFHGYDAYRNDILNSYGKRYSELFLGASAVIGVSKDMCQQLQFLGCPREKTHYLPYGIATEIFQAKQNSSSKTVVACGRFVAKKAPQLTILAFKKTVELHRDAKLIMIGDGELLEECKDLVQDLNLASFVTFSGVLDACEIAKIYQDALVFVQHSVRTSDNDSEGTPLSILEASAAGLPVVSTRHAGIVDVVEEEVTGFLVNEGDVNAMSEKMCVLLDNPNLAFEMGQNASKKMHTAFTMSKYLESLSGIIENCRIKKQS